MEEKKLEAEANVALVLGGHVNGYSIIKELYEQGIANIALFDYGRSLARFSNKVVYRAVIDRMPEVLLGEINKLKEKYEYIIIFPTDDQQLESLHAIYDQISDFCFLPFNRETLISASDKFFQYQTCDEVGVPFPKSISIKEVSDVKLIEELTFPLIVKPTTRKDLTVKVFRTLYLAGMNDYLDKKDELINLILNGLEFVASEFIPGDDTNIYAYTCFRSPAGEILNEWTGKKLTQYPDNYGVVCSASNEAPEVVAEQGRTLVEALNLFGIVEPEFKYDSRDGKYKLMEVNLRSMMWNRTGNISGVKLHETQYYYATGKRHIDYIQEKSTSTHFVLMLHEIPNLIARKKYWKHFKENVFGGDKRIWAILDFQDVKPFMYSILLLSKMSVGACLRRFGLR